MLHPCPCLQRCLLGRAATEGAHKRGLVPLFPRGRGTSITPRRPPLEQAGTRQPGSCTTFPAAPSCCRGNPAAKRARGAACTGPGLSSSPGGQRGVPCHGQPGWSPGATGGWERSPGAHRACRGCPGAGRGWGAHLDVPVVRRGLVELLAQLEGDLGVLEGALGLHGDLAAVQLDDGGGLGEAGHLPRGEAHAWGGAG